MLNLISIYKNNKIEYQLDETRIQSKNLAEIKVYLIELAILLEGEFCVIGKFALTIEFDETASSSYLMFYHLEKKDTFRQEIFIPMYQYYFEQTEFFFLQSDDTPILLNFTCPEEAGEFQEILSKIYSDLFDYYFFNNSEKLTQKELINQSETDRSRDKLTFKSLFMDAKSLLLQTFGKKVTNIKNKGAGTTSKIFKGISDKCDNVVNKLENNKEKKPSVSLMRNCSRGYLRSSPDFSSNSVSTISRRVINSNNTSENVISKRKSSSRIRNNDTLPRHQIGRRIDSMSNLVSSRRKYGASEQSLKNPGFRNQSLQRPFATKASSIRHEIGKMPDGFNRQLESSSKRDSYAPNENNIDNVVKRHNPIPNDISSELENTEKITRETPEDSVKCKPNPEIVCNNSNVKKKPMDLLQQIRSAKLTDLKKTKIADKIPETKPFANLYNIDLSDRRQHISESDNDSSDEDNF